MRNNEQNKLLVEIGKVLIQRRSELKLPRTQLALELGVDEKQIRRIERGEVSTNILTLFKICHVLNLDIAFLSNIEIGDDIMNI